MSVATAEAHNKENMVKQLEADLEKFNKDDTTRSTFVRRIMEIVNVRNVVVRGACLADFCLV